MRALEGELILKLHLFQCFDSGYVRNGRMNLGLLRDPCGFAEEGSNGGGSADTSTSVPALCGVVIDSCCYVIQWHHAWGKNVEVVDVCYQLPVIDGQKPLGVLVGEDVGLYGGAEC